MKVLYIVSSLRRSGPILVLQNITRNLGIPQNDIYIIKLLPDNVSRSITNEFISDGINVIECNFSKLKVELCPGYCSRFVAEYVSKICPDIIHVHGYQAALVASKLKTPIPKTITLHNVPTEDFVFSKGKIVGNYMVWRFKKSLKHFSRAIAISATVKKAHEQLTYNKIKIDVIYNGVNLQCASTSTINSLKDQYNISHNDRVFVVIGHLSILKDPLCIIRAFKQAFIYKHNVKLFILGSGILKDECIKEIDGDSRICLVGYTPDITSYLSIATFTISASHSEGFGLNVIESLAMGVPAILTDIPVFEEFMEFYPVLKPFKFKCGDSKNLEEVLLKAYDSEYLEIEPIRRDVNIRFSSNKMGRMYLDHYKQLKSND